MRYLQTLMVCLCFVACVQADNNDIQPIKQPQESYEIELFPIKGALRGVDVEIAGKTHRFIFDTGGGVNIISPEVARAIGCKPFGRITGFRMNGQRLDFPQCEGVELSLSNLSVITNSAVFEISSLLPADWPKIDGLISLKAIENYAFSLDLHNNQMVIKSPGLPGIESSNEIPIRLARDVGGAGLEIFAEIVTPTGSLWLLIDSANSGPVVVADHAAAMLGLPIEKNTQDVHDHDGKKVQLVPKVDLLLSDLEPITVDLAVMDIIYDGNLGTSFLEQVILIVDLPHKKAWMKALPKAD